MAYMIKSNKLNNYEKLILLAFLYFFMSELFSGILRYYLPKLGFTPIIYLPKVIFFVILFTQVLISLYYCHINRLLAVGIALFFVFSFFGYYHTGNILQVAFGLFVLVPILFGFILAKPVSKLEDIIVSFLYIFWLIAVVGVLLDTILSLPWEGASYELVGQEIRGARDWETLGVERIGGFSRGSPVVANQLLYLG